MVSDFVMTQKDIQTELTKPDSIGIGSYNSDSHNVQRFARGDGNAENSGAMLHKMSVLTKRIHRRSGWQTRLREAVARRQSLSYVDVPFLSHPLTDRL